MSKILILGGNGYIGYYLSKRLSFNNEIVVADLSIKKEYCINNIKYIPFNFCNCNNFCKYLDDIDIVIHMISTITPNENLCNLEQEIVANVFPTIQLLKDMIKTNTQKIIFLSSGGAIYGEHNVKPISEEEQTNPISNYGIIKLMIEKYLKLMGNNNFDYKIIRLANPYSEKVKNGKKQGIIPIMVERIINNESIYIWGDGKDIRDYIYMDDAIEAIVKIINYCGNENVFNVGTGVGTSINELIEIICDYLQIENVRVIYENSRICDVRNNILNINKIQREIGWKPKVKIKDGVKKIVNSKIELL